MSSDRDGSDTLARRWNSHLIDEFEGESDRACVIMAAALLDTALKSLLISRLAPTTGSTDPLFDGANAPMSTFNSRIEMCYRFGLLSSRFCRDLHLIRKIRNEFAHNIVGCKFSETSVRDRIQCLSNSCRFDSQDDSWRGLYPNTPKGRFLFGVSWMQWHIHSLVEVAEAVGCAGLEFGYTNVWASIKQDGQESEN